jgi:hypothetical protein
VQKGARSSLSHIANFGCLATEHTEDTEIFIF